MCLQPQLIRNPYTKKFMYVPCGRCDDCRIQSANLRAAQLNTYINLFPYKYLVTLTYDNEHLPVFRNDMSSNHILWRRVGYKNYDVLKVFTKTFSEYLKEECYPPTGCDDENITAVCFYDDVQKFFKRLRKNYGYEFKYFVCAEYGTRNLRPHYHIIFMFNQNPGDFKSAVVSTWQLCDWNQLKLYICKDGESAYNNSCKRIAKEGVAGYVASYVNCNPGSDGFYQEKRFRQKTYRSKDIDFSLDAEIYERIKKIVRYVDTGKTFYKAHESPFRIEYYDKEGQLSTRLISARILHSFFTKPKSSYQDSFRTFRNCCIRVLSQYYHGCKERVTSTDYLFVLAYRRFCKLMNYDEFSFHVWDVYCIYCHRILSWYECERLKEQMQSFDKKYFIEYLQDLSNTEPINPHFKSALFANFLHQMGITLRKDEAWIYETQSRFTKKMIHDRIDKFKDRLKPKHINAYSNQLIYC